MSFDNFFFGNPFRSLSRLEREMFNDPFFNWPAHRAAIEDHHPTDDVDMSTSDVKDSKDAKDSQTNNAVVNRPNREDWMTNVIRAPAFDISVTDGNYLCTVDVPGVAKEEVKLNITDNADGTHTLTVSGERKEEKESGDKAKGNYSYQTRYGKFSRSIRLPKDCNAADVKAKHENGVLKINIPRIQQKPKSSTAINIE